MIILVGLQLGHDKVLLRTLSEYTQIDDTYNKLPYGKEFFELENPALVCSWLRRLCPIRFYLCGNEKEIVDEWSNLMIQHEIDQPNPFWINDDNWFTLLVNEQAPVQEQVKWNFAKKFAADSRTQQLLPLKVKDLPDDIRFQSALRRVTKTFDERAASITAKLLNWYENSSRTTSTFDQVNYARVER